MPSTLPASMLISTLLNEYVLERAASPRYEESLRRTVKKMGSYGLSLVSQLSTDSVNNFLRSLTLAPVTRNNIRRELLTLWRYAFEQAYTDDAPVRIMRIRAPRVPPVAWSEETLSILLLAAEADNSLISTRAPNLCWSHALTAWIAVSYDTGFRFSDVLNLKEENFRNGCVVITASKTGKPAIRRLSQYGQDRVNELLGFSPDGSLFRWVLTRRRVFNKWRKMLRSLGIEGSPRYLRRSAATYVDKHFPGAAPQFLDHSNPALAPMHYIDVTLVGPTVSPPPLR